jgi:hypothetical protein
VKSGSTGTADRERGTGSPEVVVIREALGGTPERAGLAASSHGYMSAPLF